MDLVAPGTHGGDGDRGADRAGSGRGGARAGGPAGAQAAPGAGPGPAAGSRTASAGPRPTPWPCSSWRGSPRACSARPRPRWSPPRSGTPRLLGAVQDSMPDTTPTWFSRATSALTEAGFPQVFNPFENESTAEVAKPTGDSVTAAATNAAKRSTVKIEGASGHPGPRGQRLRVRPAARDDQRPRGGRHRRPERPGRRGRAGRTRHGWCCSTRTGTWPCCTSRICGRRCCASTTAPRAATRRWSPAIRRTAT